MSSTAAPVKTNIFESYHTFRESWTPEMLDGFRGKLVASELNPELGWIVAGASSDDDALIGSLLATRPNLSSIVFEQVSSGESVLGGADFL